MIIILMEQKQTNLQSLLKLNAPEFSVQPKTDPPPISDFAYPPPVDQSSNMPLSHQSSTYSEEGTMNQLMNLMSMIMDQGYTPPPPGPVMIPPPPVGPLGNNNYFIPPPPVPPPPPPPPPVNSDLQQPVNISPA